MYPVVSVLTRHRGISGPTIAVDRRTDDSSIVTVEHNYGELTLLPDLIWGFLLSSDSGLLTKIIRTGKKLESLCVVNASSTAADADAFSSILNEGNHSGLRGWKIVNTGTIDPFTLRWGSAVFTHAGTRYIQFWLIDTQGVVSENRRRQYDSPKIVFAKISNRIEAAFDSTGDFASVNTNFAFVRRVEGYYYLGLLNSWLMTWVYERYFGALRMGGGYLQFQAPQLRVLPCVKFDAGDRRMIEIATLARAMSEDTAGRDVGEETIDRLVLEIYGLNEADVALVKYSRAGADSGERRRRVRA